MHDTHWTIRFLAWWADHGGFVLFGVFLTSFIIVLIFGNYPQWVYEEEKEVFQQYLDINEEHLYLAYFTENRHGNASVSLEYNDGFSPTNHSDTRPNRDEIIRKYKSIVESRICSYPVVLQNLKTGYWKVVSVNVLDGEAFVGKPYLFNLQLDRDRCDT